MPRKVSGLTVAEVRNATTGRYGDGNGLYQLARPAGAKFWLFRYKPAGGKMREMGMGRAGGGTNAISLADARERARELMAVVRAGGDPLARREHHRADHEDGSDASADPAAERRTDQRSEEPASEDE